MKSVVLAALTVLPFLSNAQSTSEFEHFSDNGVYLSANDFKHHALTDGFDNSQPGYRLTDELFKPAVKIVEPNNQKIEIPDTQLWGERKEGVDYRLFNGELYRVEHADRIYVYSKPTGPSAIGAPGNSMVSYYFSRKPDSPIHLITSSTLKDVYYDQSDKLSAFDKLDDLSNNPARQAAKLVRIFYTEDTGTQPSHSAE